MILLGGLTTLHGPILGALAYTALGEVAQMVTERQLLVEGLVVLLVVIALPKGLSGITLPRCAPPRPAPARSRRGSRRRGRAPMAEARPARPAGARHPRAHPQLRRAGGRARRLHLAAPGRAARCHRPERRRQDHARQHALGRDQADRRAASSSMGREVAGEPAWRMTGLGVGRSFQRTNIFATLTVLENVRLAVQAVEYVAAAPPAATLHAKRGLIERAERALHRVGLAEAARASPAPSRTASSASSRSPWRWPASPRCCCWTSRWPAWGPRKSQRLTALLKGLAREHAVLLIEHDMDFVFAVADWMTVMAEGTVLARGQARGDPRQHRRAGRLSRGPCVMPAPAPDAPLLEGRELDTYYGQSHVLRGVSLAHRRRRDHRPDGPQRHGQDHADPHARRPGAAAPRLRAARRRGRDTARRPSPSPGAASPTCRRGAASSLP